MARDYEEYEDDGGDLPPRRSRGDAAGAAQQVSGPAIGLLITGIIGILVQIANVGVALTLGAQQAALNPPPGRPGAPDLQFPTLSPAVTIAQAVVGSLIGILIIIGALKMKNLQSHGLALASSILAMIPFLSPCCCIGLPVGIWAVMTLNKPEVKSAFH